MTRLSGGPRPASQPIGMYPTRCRRDLVNAGLVPGITAGVTIN
jgi:hypothetical protein